MVSAYSLKLRLVAARQNALGTVLQLPLFFNFISHGCVFRSSIYIEELTISLSNFNIILFICISTYIGINIVSGYTLFNLQTT